MTEALRLSPDQTRRLLSMDFDTVRAPVEQWCYENGVEVPRVSSFSIMDGYLMRVKFNLEFNDRDSALAFKMRWF